MFGIEKDYQKLLEQIYGLLGEKPQMTEQLLKDKLLPDTIEIGGVKYKRIEEPQTQSFYDKLWELLRTKLSDNMYHYTHNECDDMADKVRDLIREHIPPLMENRLRSEYISGYNVAIEAINRRLFNDIL